MRVMICKGGGASEDEVRQAHEVAASTTLNMSICYYLLKEYKKSVEKAEISLKHKKTVKAFYRRGKAYAMLKDYDRAISDMESAVKLDPSDVNDIQQEIVQLRVMQKAQEKQAQQKLAGFLLRDD